MSRRGIHPLLMGRDRSQRVAPKHPVQTSGLESAQRKRYLRLEAEEALTPDPIELEVNPTSTPPRQQWRVFFIA